jgi:pimeloyl-ACP methyl ester carboxylesterase
VGTCVKVAGGRRLAYDTWGDPKDPPVFLLHGTPGSRRGPRPRPHELMLMGIRLISYDRPGYGRSDRHIGRRVADAAADVEALADALGIDRFAVLGRSGGGPHALACAALLPDRVTSAAGLVSFAPRSAEGLDWFAGMGAANVREYSTAWRASDNEDTPDALTALAVLLSEFTESLTSLEFLRTNLDAKVPDNDRAVLDDPGIRTLLAENFVEAVGDARNLAVIPAGPVGTRVGRSVLLGWLDDALAASRDWGFRPEDIDVPVLLWHGEDDAFAPVGHSRWLAGRIACSTLVIEPRSAHFGALVVLPSALQWLRRYVPRVRSTA